MNAKIRWAKPDEGWIIQTILESRQVPLATWADWSKPIGPFWLILETDIPIGCINVNPGHPVGRLEWLVVRKNIPRRMYACAIRDLGFAGVEILRQQGSQMIACQIVEHEQGWQKVLQRRGFIQTEPGALYVGRLHNGNGDSHSNGGSISRIHRSCNVTR